MRSSRRAETDERQVVTAPKTGVCHSLCIHLENPEIAALPEYAKKTGAVYKLYRWQASKKIYICKGEENPLVKDLLSEIERHPLA